MSRLFWILVAPLCLSCAVGPAPHASRAAVPIKSACTAGSRPPSAVGLDVRAGRRHSEARTLFVTNLGDRPRSVRVQQIGRVEGPCAGDWARQTPLEFVDATTGQAPVTTTIQPKDQLELRIGEQRVAGTWECAKLGLALWMAVDEEAVCADAGAWIATREGDDGLDRY